MRDTMKDTHLEDTAMHDDWCLAFGCLSWFPFFILAALGTPDVLWIPGVAVFRVVIPVTALILSVAYFAHATDREQRKTAALSATLAVSSAFVLAIDLPLALSVI